MFYVIVFSLKRLSLSASTESNDNQDKQNSIPLLRNKRNKANDLLIKDIRDNGDDIFGHLDDVDLEKILTDFAPENLGGVDKFDKLMLEAAGQILKVEKSLTIVRSAVIFDYLLHEYWVLSQVLRRLKQCSIYTGCMLSRII
uniref:Uncharacterized protein n=1 Tax=Heterorhabditis bacteriophora TaxID=37862 RepID=A0A1I7WL49_HETBA